MDRDIPILGEIMDQLNRANDDEINLYDFWLAILKRKKLIIGLFLIGVISVAIISFLMPNIYRGDTVLSTTI
jgi:uncharacterized protein involved in exopolysaccharide biosynthesis